MPSSYEHALFKLEHHDWSAVLSMPGYLAVITGYGRVRTKRDLVRTMVRCRRLAAQHEPRGD